MTPQARQGEVPGAGSPLTRAVLVGPSRQAMVLASFPTALYLSVGGHHEVLPVLASDASMLPTGTRLSAPGRDIVWGIGPGDPVTVGRSRITLPGWAVNVVREWRPARVRAVPSFMREPAERRDVGERLLVRHPVNCRAVGRLVPTTTPPPITITSGTRREPTVPPGFGR